MCLLFPCSGQTVHTCQVFWHTPQVSFLAHNMSFLVNPFSVSAFSLLQNAPLHSGSQHIFRLSEQFRRQASLLTAAISFSEWDCCKPTTMNNVKWLLWHTMLCCQVVLFPLTLVNGTRHNTRAMVLVSDHGEIKRGADRRFGGCCKKRLNCL